jgi:hypothetical protein
MVSIRTARFLDWATALPEDGVKDDEQKKKNKIGGRRKSGNGLPSFSKPRDYRLS